jgi:hypothetical protein
MNLFEEPRHYTQLRDASAQLLSALWREHPHIIESLKNTNTQSKGPSRCLNRS